MGHIGWVYNDSTLSCNLGLPKKKICHCTMRTRMMVDFCGSQHVLRRGSG